MRRIVISGSMQFYDRMMECAQSMRQRGFVVVTPKEDDWESISPEHVNEYKRDMSLQYLHEVANQDTDALLVVNETKKEIANYIGANAFAEITIAFFQGKEYIC